jgi:hypothetical protein
VKPLRKQALVAHSLRPAHSAAEAIGGPLVWTFDGALGTCLADMEDALRRAIVQVGDVASVAVLIEISLPALERRVAAGDAIQPAWGRMLERMTDRYGLPAPPRVHPLGAEGPLVTLVIAYRS